MQTKVRVNTSIIQTNHLGGTKEEANKYNGCLFNKHGSFKCYNCHRKGQLARNWIFEPVDQSNVIVAQDEDPRDTKTLFTQERE